MMKQQSNSARGLKHSLAPIFAFLFMALFVYLSAVLTLPEKLETYYILLLIFAFLLALNFMVVTVPCALSSGFFAVMAIWRDRKFVLPIVSIFLDCASLIAWGFCLRTLIF